MLIESVTVRNFRSLKDSTLVCDHLTALVGRNGTGKSSFLRALELFYATSPRLRPEDFYNEDTTSPIEIEVQFRDLSDEEFGRFSKYVDGSSLVVTKVVTATAGKLAIAFHGSTLQCAEFQAIRQAGSADEAKERYAEMRSAQKWQTLPQRGTKKAILEELDTWESNNPNECIRLRDNGQFFGLSSVATGYLGAHTRFVSIPAVRDAADDASDTKSSPITELMDIVVRAKLEARDDVKDLREATQAEYDKIMAPQNMPEIAGLAASLTSTLQSYVTDAEIKIAWTIPSLVELPMPLAELRLVEDGYASTVERTGHGLQRAFVLTLLQHLVATRDTEHDGSELSQAEQNEPLTPDVILAIEEPELYQHPNRQRHLARVLMQLSRTAGPLGSRTQVIYVTHSPLFVGIDRFDLVRILRKRDGGRALPKVTQVTSSTADSVALALWTAQGSKGERYTADTLLARLQSLMTPWMSEGFFADLVVLVEGEDDRAALSGTATGLGHDLDSLGVAVIPCGGKSNLDRPLLIFRSLDIPVYVIWDSDRGVANADPKRNEYMLRLVGAAEADWASVVEDSYAAFEVDLGRTVAGELGEGFDKLVSDAQQEFGIPKKAHAMKNPRVVEWIMHTALESGRSSPTMERIVQKIVEAASRSGR